MIKFLLFLIMICQFVSFGFIYKIQKDNERIGLAIQVVKFNTYCNRYEIEGLQHYGKYPDSYPDIDSVMFPDICVLQDLLTTLYAIKYLDYKPTTPISIGMYDTYFTGRYDEQIKKQLNAHIIDVESEIYQLLLEK